MVAVEGTWRNKVQYVLTVFNKDCDISAISTTHTFTVLTYREVNSDFCKSLDLMYIALLQLDLFMDFQLLIGNLIFRIKHLNYLKQTIVFNCFIFCVSLGWNVYFNYQINFTSILFNILIPPLISFLYIASWLLLFIKPHNFYIEWNYFILFYYIKVLLVINLVWNVDHFNIYFIFIYYGFFILGYYYLKLWKKIFFIMN